MAAEIMGIVVGTIPLTTLLQSCVSLYEQIHSLRTRSADIDYLMLRTTFEHRKFLLLEEILRSPTNPGQESFLSAILTKVEQTLTQLHKLLRTHAAASEDAVRSKQKFTKKLNDDWKWMGSDRKEIADFVSRLKELNDMLQTFVPHAYLVGLNYGLIAQSVATTNTIELSRIQAAAVEQGRTGLAAAAAIRVSRIENLGNSLSHTNALTNSQISNVHSFKWVEVPRSRPSQAGTTLQVHEIRLDDAVQKERVLASLTRTASISNIVEELLVLVEWRHGFQSTNSPETKRQRLNQLVHAIDQLNAVSAGSLRPNPTSPSPGNPAQLQTSEHQVTTETSMEFGVMNCLGWITTDSNFSRVGLVFRGPSNNMHNMVSLRDKIQEDRRRKMNPPALGTRFAMAVGLVERVANLIMVGWVHKSIRSDNVLLFGIGDNRLSQAGNHSDNTNQDDESCRWTHGPYLTGFTYSRPDHKGVSTDFSNPSIYDPLSELYRPPNKVLSAHSLDNFGEDVSPTSTSNVNQPATFDATFDVYGLGIILLEIGLWNTVQNLYNSMRAAGTAQTAGGGPSTQPYSLTIEEFQQSNQLRNIIKSLDSRVGTIYRKVVSKCLDLEGWWEVPASMAPMPSSNQVPGTGLIDRRAEFLKVILTWLLQCKA